MIKDCEGCKHFFYERDTNYAGCNIDEDVKNCKKKECVEFQDTREE